MVAVREFADEFPRPIETLERHFRDGGMPLFSVFQTPPDPTPTYQVLRSDGWIAMSAMRPPMSAGPMLRIGRLPIARARGSMSYRSSIALSLGDGRFRLDPAEYGLGRSPGEPCVRSLTHSLPTWRRSDETPYGAPQHERVR